MNSSSGGLRSFKNEKFAGVIRVFGLFLLALAAFALVLLIFGKNPIKAYIDIFGSTLGSGYGLSETLVKMIPLILTAVAVAVPSRIWLINVGERGSCTSELSLPPGERSLSAPFRPGFFSP